MDRKLHKKKILQHIISFFLLISLAPFIVSLDIFIEIYHRIDFRLCNIPLVKRREYIKIDRHKLRYLNWFDKLGCVYCGYANGCARYFTEIGSRTEKYWCAIKHKKTPNFKEQPHQKNFLKYGDAKSYERKYK
jgi:hypothetical protein